MTDELLRILIVLIGSTIGSGGLTFVFGVEKKHAVSAIISSVLCCGAYELTALCGGGIFLSAFIGTAVMAAYSDIMAHVLKVPATVMIIIGIIPLVPGARLYYTMLGLVQSDMELFSTNGRAALMLAAGVAIGVIAVTAISRPINVRISERHQKMLQERELERRKTEN